MPTPKHLPLSQYDDRVNALIKQMTLEEKIGQMAQYSDSTDITGPCPPAGKDQIKYQQIAKGLVGSFLNIRGVEAVRKAQEEVLKNSRLGIPVLFGYDVIHGHKTQAPIPLAESASWDLDAIEAGARMAAIEGAASGLNWTFAPMVDTYRDARWGRVMEGAGEDPYLGSAIARARVRGFQGDDLSDPLTLAATPKHFVGYGFAEAGREYNTVDVGTYTLYNILLPPFKAALEEGAVSVMNGFNVLNGTPVTGDAFLQRDILKGQWGFEGLVVSDWASVGEMVQHGFAADPKDAARLGVQAGSDMDMEAYAYVSHLQELVEAGEVDEALIDDAVRRILRVKFALGLFDDPYRYCDPEREKALLYAAEHQKTVLDIAKKSVVLLKNEGNLLPLDKGQSIGFIGALAADKTSPLGSWRLGSDDETAVSVLEGVAAYLEEVHYEQGPAVFLGETSFTQAITVNETDRTGMEAAVALAQKVDTVVMVLGEHGFQSGEGRSRTRLDLPGLQPKLLRAVHAVNPNIVLVLMNGRPLALSWEDANIPAILETWHLGSQSGNAIAEVLFGDYNPSGKLTMSFPRHVGQVPIYYNRFRTGRPQGDGAVFWSHYSDEENSPLYPFGHGLSYTQFTYSDLQVDASNPKRVKVSVTVTNSGDRAGEEVVQLYLHDPVASAVRPVQELKGFAKIGLAVGEQQRVIFWLCEAELGFCLPSGQFTVEPGLFRVMVGGSSAKGLEAAFDQPQGC